MGWMDFLTPLELEALSLSLRVAGVAVAASLIPGVAIGWLLARYRFPGKSLLDGLVHFPLVAPPIVIGYLLLVTLGRRGVVGSWLYENFGVSFGFSWRGAAVAAGVVGFPLLVRSVRLSVEAIDRRLEVAASTLGACPWRSFVTITLPLMSPGILAGMTLAFARALGEFGATISFVSNIPGETRTLPLAIYAQLQIPGGEAAAGRLMLVSLFLAFAALIVSEIFSRTLRRRLYGGAL